MRTLIHATYITPPLQLQDEDERNRFLDLVAIPQRSRLVNLFKNQGPRVGQFDAAAIVRNVRKVLQNCAENTALPEQSEISTALLTILEANHALAVEFARYIVKEHALPAPVRQTLKQEKADQYVKNYMANQPPTEKQLAFLRSLGHEAAVSSKLEASQIINRLTAGRKG